MSIRWCLETERKLSRNTDHWVLVTWSNLSSLIYWFSWHQKMKSNMAHWKICKKEMFPWGDITLLTIDWLLIFKNMFLCWQHGIPKKNTEGERYLIRRGPGNPHLLEEAQDQQWPRSTWDEPITKGGKMNWILSSLFLEEWPFLPHSSGWCRNRVLIIPA